jgi:hypothetical protein
MNVIAKKLYFEYRFVLLIFLLFFTLILKAQDTKKTFLTSKLVLGCPKEIEFI